MAHIAYFMPLKNFKAPNFNLSLVIIMMVPFFKGINLVVNFLNNFRHMVASRDIKAGETVFKEAPLTFGPSESSKPICLGQWFLNFLCIYPLFHIFDGFHTALIKIKFFVGNGAQFKPISF